MSRTPSRRTEKVVEFVRAHPGATSGEIGAALGDHTFATIPPSLVFQRRLRREKRGHIWTYFVPEKATQAPGVAEEKK